MGKVEVHALKGVSFEIEQGEFVAIMGPSGSGKSTLLHQLGLLDTPTSGKILIDGVDVLRLSDREKTIYRLTQLGYVFQDYAILPELTAAENVYLPAMVQGKSKELYLRSSRELLETVGLGDRLHHLPQELSGGEQQRVAIARALINKPKILFADEPCANLDTESSRHILELFRKLNEELGQTILMVSHEEWHKKYVDRIIYLKDGLIEKM
ncbi:MAG: ABC transporter ATP-binding protein [Methanophagales archaeon]|nr:ABC transporter ATP-binding protein [Methanophagales archaeon]MCW3134587.1 ABC transporter ATP-binding protein [Methanophagales archaeon]